MKVTREVEYEDENGLVEIRLDQVEADDEEVARLAQSIVDETQCPARQAVEEARRRLGK